jgi:cadmium resistance protein CadD (predicted permease)
MALDPAQAATIVTVTVISYASTNLDNLLLAVLLMGANRDHRGAIQLGVVSAAVVVMLLCALGLVIRHTVDAGLVGYLGLVPVALGIRYLLASRDTGQGQPFQPGSAAPDARAAWLTTTTVMAANSGDTIALFLPLLADTSPDVFPLVAISYVITALVWALLAWGLASRPWIARNMEKHGAKFLPWIMIGVGIYILANTATDSIA